MDSGYVFISVIIFLYYLWIDDSLFMNCLGVVMHDIYDEFATDFLIELCGM